MHKHGKLYCSIEFACGFMVLINKINIKLKLCVSSLAMLNWTAIIDLRSRDRKFFCISSYKSIVEFLL